MNKQKLMKSKLISLKNTLKKDPSLANAQATVSALFMSDAIMDCNTDEYDQLGLDNAIYDESEAEDQAVYHIQNDGSSYVDGNKRILRNVRKSNCEWFIQCGSVTASEVFNLIDGLIDNEMGPDSYGQIEDDANLNFEAYRRKAYQKFANRKLATA